MNWCLSLVDWWLIMAFSLTSVHVGQNAHICRLVPQACADLGALIKPWSVGGCFWEKTMHILDHLGTQLCIKTILHILKAWCRKTAVRKLLERTWAKGKCSRAPAASGHCQEPKATKWTLGLASFEGQDCHLAVRYKNWIRRFKRRCWALPPWPVAKGRYKKWFINII